MNKDFKLNKKYIAILHNIIYNEKEEDNIMYVKKMEV